MVIDPDSRAVLPSVTARTVRTPAAAPGLSQPTSTPTDAVMMMRLDAEGVLVGSGIFKSVNPVQRAEAIVKATTFFDAPDVVAKVCRGLGEAMVGINVEIPQLHHVAERGW